MASNEDTRLQSNGNTTMIAAISRKPHISHATSCFFMQSMKPIHSKCCGSSRTSDQRKLVSCECHPSCTLTKRRKILQILGGRTWYQMQATTVKRGSPPSSFQKPCFLLIALSLFSSKESPRRSYPDQRQLDSLIPVVIVVVLFYFMGGGAVCALAGKSPRFELN